MLPDFVIIGAQKSASSFMQACLADHPDIYLPTGETPFFESPDYERGDISQLEALFEGRREPCLGIKRPSYIGKPEVPGRIASCLPDAKLIAVLRNPVDRAVSAYYHYVNGGYVPPLHAEQGMRRLISDPSFVSRYKRSAEIIEFGYYYKYLRRFDHFLKNERLLVFLHEDIAQHALESVQTAYDFLGTSPDFVPGSLDSRPQSVMYNLTRLRVRRLGNRYRLRYNEDKTRASPRKMSYPEQVIAGAVRLIDRQVLSRVLPNHKPAISSELRSLLYDKYAEDISALETLIARDLGSWRAG